jgi:hypothetical protein
MPDLDQIKQVEQGAGATGCMLLHWQAKVRSYTSVLAPVRSVMRR